MPDKTKYKCSLTGGMARIAMPKGTQGQEYTRTEGKHGIIYFRPVKEA